MRVVMTIIVNVRAYELIYYPFLSQSPLSPQEQLPPQLRFSHSAQTLDYYLPKYNRKLLHIALHNNRTPDS